MKSTTSPPPSHAPTSNTASPIERDAHTWARLLAPYRRANSARGWIELSLTLVPFILLWALAAWAATVSVWLSLALSLPLAGLLVRLFAIQHDCGHGSFFASKRLNDFVGSCLAVPTVTPYLVWKQAHKQHHATSGHLDRRGIGAIHTLTVTEYQKLSLWGRTQYRIYRNPLILFLIGPAFVFFFQNRLPVEFMRDGWRYWISAMGTNLGIIAVSAALIWAFGWVPFFIVFVSSTLIASMVGVWLFYVQHQFEETHWRRSTDWNLQEAALHGSSHYDLPVFLRWLTANIGIHHVHHLNSRIPSYRLSKTLKDYPELAGMNRLTLMSSLASLHLHLWDEVTGRLVPFSAVRAISA